MGQADLTPKPSNGTTAPGHSTAAYFVGRQCLLDILHTRCVYYCILRFVYYWMLRVYTTAYWVCKILHMWIFTCIILGTTHKTNSQGIVCCWLYWENASRICWAWIFCMTRLKSRPTACKHRWAFRVYSSLNFLSSKSWYVHRAFIC